MISVLLYCLSVFTILILYYFYKPIDETEHLNLNQHQIENENFSDYDAQQSVALNTQLSTSSTNSINLNSANQQQSRSLISDFFYNKLDKETIYKYLGLHTDTVSNQIFDSYKTFDDLLIELNKTGIQSCDVIIGVDFTASNEWKGRKTFNSQCLHKTLANKIFNPYQKVISILGFVLQNLNNTQIHAFGFGDSMTENKSVFSFSENLNQSYKTFDELLTRYNEIVKKVKLSGPTSFAPIINKAVEMVKQKKSFHILIIIADGKVSNENELETIKAIENASNYSLSIILIGVGDGPWEQAIKYDDKLVKRKFDNFQFVDYHKTIRNSKNPDVTFALKTLMEIPQQYKEMKIFGYLDTK